MNKIILELVEKYNIEVTIKSFKYKDQNFIGFDVNTGAKSGLVLVENEDGSFDGYGRYDNIFSNLNTVLDVAETVRSCMYGRDYVNHCWLNLMESLQVIKVKRKVVTTISF